jgi:hypothetical protein
MNIARQQKRQGKSFMLLCYKCWLARFCIPEGAERSLTYVFYSQRGSVETNNHKPDLVLEQIAKQADFIFGKWQWRGHELNSFAIVQAAVARAKSACGERCRGQQKDERQESFQRGRTTAAPNAGRRWWLRIDCVVSCWKAF